MILRGSTAVVTGCNRGIGKAILDAMVTQGASVFALVRCEDRSFTDYCARLAASCGVDIQIVYADFKQEDEVKAAAIKILQTKQKIDILVNNIGFSYPFKMLAMTPMSTVKEVFQINFFSPLLFTQLISKKMMREKHGSVIFISSTAVFDGGSDIAYTASKSAIIGAVKRLSIEFGAFGIRVNAIAPGRIDTDMGHNGSEEDIKNSLDRSVMKRMGETKEVADVAVFLASEQSQFMTGQVLRVDGGLL